LRDYFEKFETFDQYWERITHLRSIGQTTGAIQTKEMLQYSEMSYVRMNRIIKHAVLTPELIKAVQSSTFVNGLIITEAWCGDASNTVPLMVKAAQHNPGINLRIMVRDEHPEIMQNYLTNGAKSIPILVFFDENYKEIKRWGPRPEPCQSLFLELKQAPNLTKEQMMHNVQEWYVKDKGQTFMHELTSILQGTS
jgi:hypothetical protein